MPPDVAFGQFEQAAKPLRRRAQTARRQIQKGAGVARAGQAAGLFAEFDAELLNAAEAAGKLSEAYFLLADVYEQKVRFWQQVRAKSLMPAFVLSLSLFIEPLPDLILGRVGFLGYLRESLGVVLALAGAAWLAWRLRGLARLPPVEFLQLHTPLWRGWHLRRQMKKYFQALALLLAGGVSLFAALPKARGAVDNRLLRRRLQAVERGVRRGLRFHEALAALPEAAPSAILFIKSGELAGSLAGTLAHYVRLEAEAIQLHNAALSEWLPRLFYWLVLASMAYRLVAAGGPAPVPEF